MMTAVTEHRRVDIRAALERCFWRLLQTQNEDGGFQNYVTAASPPKSLKRRLAERSGLIQYLPASFQTPSSAGVWHYGGWQQLACPFTESDSWSAWFRPLALRLIADTYPISRRPAAREIPLVARSWMARSAFHSKCDDDAMITAIVPCFNAEPYLDEALASIRAQTRPIDQVIVVETSDGCLAGRSESSWRNAASDARQQRTRHRTEPWNRCRRGGRHRLA